MAKYIASAAAAALLSLGLLALGVWHAYPIARAPRVELPSGVVGVRSGTSYVYVVPGEQGVVLVNAGSRADALPVIDLLREMGLTPEAVKAVLLTHAHRDARGGLAAFPEAVVYAGAEDHEILLGDASPRALVPRLLARHLARLPAPKRYRNVLPGERLVLAGLTFDVIGTPGVTAGGRMYVHNKIVFAGPGLFADGAGNPQLAPRWLADAPADLARSVWRLRNIPFEHLAHHTAGVRLDVGTALREHLQAQVAAP